MRRVRLQLMRLNPNGVAACKPCEPCRLHGSVTPLAAALQLILLEIALWRKGLEEKAEKEELHMVDMVGEEAVEKEEKDTAELRADREAKVAKAVDRS